MDNAEAQLRFFVRLIRLEKVLPPLPTVNDALTASFFGIPVELLAQVRQSLAAEVETSARALLSDPAFAKAVAGLPFTKGGTVVGLGDSLTADAQSWFEILARLVQIARPDDGVQFVNAGVSGETTTQMLARLPFVAAARPTHVICLAGGNDARHFGSAAAPVQVSLQETERNLFTLRAALPDADWLQLVPPPGCEQRLQASPFWASMQTHWKSDDLDALRKVVRHQDVHVLDLAEVFGTPLIPDMLLDDGLHPSLKGHVEIAKSVVRELARA